eukprot:TRINITY_DN2696_c0_g1_i1.p1 TRINITY_DN2696_c0_g1~~TRINITY_DN2696_c0_g1_i1.p1  ORF type:complete len:850 (-),score=162.98 TRINITY_DN2696_c0_g1_i1:242-2791(-)
MITRIGVPRTTLCGKGAESRRSTTRWRSRCGSLTMAIPPPTPRFSPCMVVPPTLTRGKPLPRARMTHTHRSSTTHTPVLRVTTPGTVRALVIRTSAQEQSLFFAAWNQESTASNPRGSHDALKISWSCQGIASTQIAPAVAPYESGGHPQGYRKSTGQRTSGHEPFYADERASCSTLPDVTGFNPHCLVHAYDQPPAPRWGAHSLQDGPAITIQVQGPTQTWPANDGADSLQHLCIMRAVDPYGKWSNMTVTINVEKELNQAPEASWRAGGNTTYTVPHDHSPESHHVQVLLDGEYSDDDNLDQNFGPLGNTAQETTDMGIQNQLRWQVTDPDETTDGYDGIFVGDAPARRYVGSGYCKEGTYSATKDFTAASLAACQDACHDWLECHTLFWNSTNSLCWMFNDCVNNDDDQITDLGTGERYTKEQSYGTSWAMFRGRSDAYHPNDHMHGHGNDTVRFLWTCPTASGEFFEETLGHCFEGADTAAASVAENANKSAFCRSWENTTIAGDLHDFCQDACIATEGCRGFEIYDVEYRGACPVESCDASRCELMMLTEDPYEEATNDCPGGFSTHNAVSYSGELNSNNNLHGNGAREARCFTRKQGQQFDILKPVVSLPGPEWTSTSTWSEPGGQVGETSDGGDQWSAEYLDHTCTLRVTDSYEATHTFEQTIRVNREPNTVPQAMAGPDQEYTVPHDFNPETNQVLVTLYGYNSTDADMDKMKHVWNCTMGEAQTAWATVELPFPVILGGIDQGFQTSDKGGIQTGSGDPNYVYSASHVQTAMGWGQDRGHSGDGDDFMGTHSHQANQVTVMLVNGTHTCTVTSTDTYNQASQDSVTIVVNPEPDSAPESD